MDRIIKASQNNGTKIKLTLIELYLPKLGEYPSCNTFNDDLAMLIHSTIRKLRKPTSLRCCTLVWMLNTRITVQQPLPLPCLTIQPMQHINTAMMDY
jgi:hypothetical protein